MKQISGKTEGLRWARSLRGKITFSLAAIAATLLASCIISVMEYRHMSSYVSDLIAENIKHINAAQALSEAANDFNLEILTVIGDENLSSLPEFDQPEFLSHCDSLRAALAPMALQPLVDSVLYSYSAYMLTSLELTDVLASDFIDTRSWYFDRLQPAYGRLSSDIGKMSTAFYIDLKRNSATFDRGFYRSTIPGIVAVGVGLLLILMLLFFIMAYYVNPIYKMQRALDNYITYNRKYNYTFDGDDQLGALNDSITDITNENQQLRSRLSNLKSRTQSSI